MAATLNKDDVKLLQSVFATKKDLEAMERRHNKNLIGMENRQDKKYATKKDLEQLESIIASAFQQIETEFRSRIRNLEENVGVSPLN